MIKWAIVGFAYYLIYCIINKLLYLQFPQDTKKKSHKPKRLDDPNYAPYKCNIVAFRKQWEKLKQLLQTQPLLMEKLRKELEKTPFWKIIKIYDDGMLKHMEEEDDKCSGSNFQKSDITLSRILKCYCPAEKKFIFGNTAATLSATDIHTTFGLPNEGLVLPLPSNTFQKNSVEESSIKRYFEGKTVIRKTAIENAIICAITAGEKSVKDVSKLVILHLLCTLLFVNSGKSAIQYYQFNNDCVVTL